MTLLPLYKLPENIPDPAAEGTIGNIGLWYDKFCNQWRENSREGVWELGEDKQKWIAKAQGISTSESLSSAKSLLEELNTRRSRMVATRGGIQKCFKAESAFLAGMGRSHPVENGITWHPICGVPYLPGSSLKGVVRNWCEYWCEPEDGAGSAEAMRLKAIVRKWFGSEAKDSKDNQLGRFIFLDAMPWAFPNLCGQVMTPHLGQWFVQGVDERDESTIPGDWHSPKPIPFIAVARRTLFHVAIMPVGSIDEAGEQELKDIFAATTQALDWLGAGAKTAVGMGRMIYDEPKTRNLIASINEWKATAEASQDTAQTEEQQAQVDVPPETQLLIDLLDENRQNQENAISTGCRILKVNIIQEPEQRIELARYLKELMIAEGKWRTATGGSPAQKKANRKTVQIKNILGED